MGKSYREPGGPKIQTEFLLYGDDKPTESRTTETMRVILSNLLTVFGIFNKNDRPR